MKWYFVIPWYGTHIPGGAEAECRGAATHLRQAGVEVEILTTTIRDFMSDWSENAYEPGTYEEEGVPVHRFAVRPTYFDIFGYINDRLLRDEKIRPEEEEYFFKEMLRSDDLLAFIENDRESLFIFIPYLFSTTVYGAALHPERSLLLPCLHDEPYATLTPIRKTFESCRGILFNVHEEMDLANRLYRLDGKPRHVVGIGLDTSIEGDARRFRSTYGIDGPFILYAGRQDKGKNTPLLVRYFHRFLQSYKGDLKLVLMGSGGVPIPDTIQGSVRSLGFVPVQDKIDAYKAATVFCQPSVNESFSLVIMESWLQETPVLVHGDCPVTKGHCLRSNGGLYFSNYPEFEEALSLLLRDDSLRTRMGRAGRTYVLENYRWDIVVERYKQAVRGIFGEA